MNIKNIKSWVKKNPILSSVIAGAITLLILSFTEKENKFEKLMEKMLEIKFTKLLKP